MSPEFRSLLSKEWSERRRMFQLGSTMFLVFLGYSIAYELEYKTRALVAAFHSTALIFGCISAILLAMSTVSGEYSQRTIKFSQSLPVRLSTVAWARLLGAWGSLLIPIIVGASTISLLLVSGAVEQAGLRSEVMRLPDRPSLSRWEAIGFLWTVTAVAITVILHFVTLLSLLGTRCRTEGSVGLLGAIGFLGVLALTTIRPSLERQRLFLIADWIGALLPQSMAINWGYQEIDGSNYTDLELAPLILGPVLINLVITLLLATWFTRFYGRRSESVAAANNRGVRWVPYIRLPEIMSRLAVRFPNRLAALIWLDARQSVPLSLAGLLMALLIALVGMGVSRGQENSTFLTRLAGELPSTTWFVGGLWGVIVAVAIFSPELKPGLEHFWRSRPIKPGSWFWAKFVVGLLAVVITLDLIPAMISSGFSTNSSKRIGVAYFACIPWIHVVMYATAVAAISRIRRPVPAAIAALIFFYVLDSVLKSIPSSERLSTLDVYNSLDALEKQGTPVDLMSHGYPIVYGIVLLVIITATVMAYRSLMPLRRLGHRVPIVLVLGLSGLLGSANAIGGEPALKDVIEGMRRRDAVVHDIKLRVSTEEQRSDVYLNNNRAMQHGRRGAAAAAELARSECKQFELFERLPCRAWSELDASGKVITTSAFDGAILRHFTAGNPRGSYRSSSTRSVQVPFQRPESLMAIGGTDLVALLEQAASVSIATRSESGEELIDLSFTNPALNTFSETSPGFATTRYRVTINATRDYWPVDISYDFLTGEGTLQTRNEVTASGWIDAGPLVYPKRITNRVFQQRHTSSPKSQELELVLTIESEVTEATVNTGIPDEMFAPKFPAGSILFDENQRKYIEVDRDGEEHVYVPTPKGIRGAVAAYQLLILVAGVVYLFRRQTVA